MSKTAEIKQTLIERFGDKYDGTQIEYINSRTEVSVGCAKHGPIKILPRDIERRSYICKQCRDEEKSEAKTKSLVAKIEKKHPGKFDFTKTRYVDSRTALTVTCIKHQEDCQIFPNDIDRDKHICNECRNEFLHDLYVSSTEEFIEKATKVHGKHYDYSKVSYAGSHEQVKLICPVHGEFDMPARSHLSGRGCAECGHERSNESKRGKKRKQPAK